MEHQPITREGFDKLRNELRHLEEVDMPAIAERIGEARAEGDLRENAEYHGQREEQGRLALRISLMKTRLAGCYIVDKAEMPKGIVTFGSTVTVKDLGLNEDEKYEFVGPGEENYDGPVMKILTTSPIAQALMGKKVGDKVKVKLPRGSLDLQVLVIADHE